MLKHIGSFFTSFFLFYVIFTGQRSENQYQNLKVMTLKIIVSKFNNLIGVIT